MNAYFLAAAALLVLTGAAHSILGERLIFRRLRGGTLVPTEGGPRLREPHVRIMWASWHAQTLLGLALAWLLVVLADAGAVPLATTRALANGVAVALLGAALLVLGGTRGRHPGWAALTVVAALVWLGRPDA